MWMSSGSPWWVPGAVLIFFGVMIAAFPELLSFMVAAAFLFFGASLLLIGWGVRRAARRQETGMFYREWERWPW